METIENLVTMYKNGGITDYVLERELTALMGPHTDVSFSKDPNNSIEKSFIIFAYPQKLEEGFHISFFLDKEAVRTYYSPKAFSVMFLNLKETQQSILIKFNDFLKETTERDISFDYAVGFLLSLYASYEHAFKVGETNFLQDDAEVMKMADKFSMEDATTEDLENILIKEMIPQDIIELVKNFVAKVSNAKDAVPKIKVVDFDIEQPTFNLGQQEVMKYCSSTLGARDHKEIPFDYTPSTNQ